MSAQRPTLREDRYRFFFNDKSYVRGTCYLGQTSCQAALGRVVHGVNVAISHRNFSFPKNADTGTFYEPLALLNEIRSKDSLKVFSLLTGDEKMPL